MPAYRSPVSVSQAVSRELIHRFRLAGVVGAGAALAVWILNGFFRFEIPVSPSLAAAGGLAMFGVSAIALTVPYVVSPRELPALGVYYWLATASPRSKRSGFSGRVPATPRQAGAWLARHPDDTAGSRGARLFASLVVGDVESAHRHAERLPSSTDLERFEYEAAAALVRMVRGDDPDVARLRRLGHDLGSDADRAFAESEVTILSALTAAADDGDWRAPLLEWRERNGSRSIVTVIRLMWLPVMGLLAVQAGLVTLAAFVLRALVA